MKYELIGGPLAGEVRDIDMTIQGKAVGTWNFWTGQDELTTYKRHSKGRSARAKYAYPSLLFVASRYEKMTHDRKGGRA
jgi:hypothetical protein